MRAAPAREREARQDAGERAQEEPGHRLDDRHARMEPQRVGAHGLPEAGHDQERPAAPRQVVPDCEAGLAASDDQGLDSLSAVRVHLAPLVIRRKSSSLTRWAFGGGLLERPPGSANSLVPAGSGDVCAVA